MTATDDLRRMLDERGVKWTRSCYSGMRYLENTKWPIASSNPIKFTEYSDGQTKLIIDNATPEQAIAATLERGECEIETTENWLPAEMYHRCKHCGAFFAVLDASGDIPPCVCPNCGRKVKR